MTRDLNFILGLMDNFLKSRQIRKKLLYFKEIDCNDWECWLQLEFDYFLETEETVGKAYRECSYSVRKNAKINNSIARADIAVRKKGSQKDTYSIIEFKVNRYRDYCLAGMITDNQKIRSLKKSEFDGRSTFYIGFFYDRDHFKIKNHEIWLRNYLEERASSLAIRKISKIGRTGVNMVILE